jgi:hypothetical protein
MKFKGSHFFIFDVESIGIHGEAFAVAGGVYKDGKALHEFAYHCSSDLANGTLRNRGWVKDNVRLSKDSVRLSLRKDILSMFWTELRSAREVYPNLVIAVECGWPVEARFLNECIDSSPINRENQGPYPLHEIASFMEVAGMDCMETYDRLPNELPAHEPLADSRLSARLLFEALNKLM